MTARHRLSLAVVAGLAGLLAAAAAEADPKADAKAGRRERLSAPVLKIAKQLIKGEGRLKVLYFGNSRVSGVKGFGMAGAQAHARERGLLIGTGFIDPSYRSANGGALFSAVTTDGVSVSRLAKDVQLNTPGTHGVRLTPGQHITTSGLTPRDAIKSSDALVFTVIYRQGPGEGRFTITPYMGPGVNTMKPMTARRVTINAAAEGEPAAAVVTIKVPGVKSGTAVRGIKIVGLSRRCHIYDLHVVSEASKGLSVGRIAVGAHGYENQMRTDKGDSPRCRREDFVIYVRSFDPDVVVLQFADNQRSAKWVASARELLARVRLARKGKPFLTVLQVDHRSPFVHSKYKMELSRKHMAELYALEKDCLLLDAEPHLPSDWPPRGTSKKSKYFKDPVHETALGARKAWDAMFLDMIRTVYPTKAELDAGGCGPGRATGGLAALVMLGSLLLLQRRQGS